MSNVVGETKTIKRSALRRRTEELPFDVRERQHVAHLLRRTRLRNFIGTVMVMIMLVCGLFALSVIRLSSDPNYVRPW